MTERRDDASSLDPLSSAAAITRGTRRLLRQLGLASAPEVTLPNGQRADILALNERSGHLWLIEVKSGPPDLRSDRKWPAYRGYCDALCFAVGPEFPRAILPQAVGVIVADAHDGELLAEPPVVPLSGARRRSLTQRLARQALDRLHGIEDPWAQTAPPPR